MIMQKAQIYEIIAAMLQAASNKDFETFNNLKSAFAHLKDNVAFLPGEFEFYDNCAYFCETSLQVSPGEYEEHLKNAKYYFKRIKKPQAI